MGLPATEDLLEILQRALSPAEAEVLLLLPTAVPPLVPVDVDTIISQHAQGLPGSLDSASLAASLEALAGRGLVYSASTDSGRPGYALLQAGFGFPQTFFWDAPASDEAREMAGLVAKYSNRRVTTEMFARTPTKPYRYVPHDDTLHSGMHAVVPHHAMGPILDAATRFAVAHCSCRVAAGLLGKGCEHPLEVCLKFDELADYLIERGLGREIDRDEARAIVQLAADSGLVHFADNAGGKVKHNCNCCGDACWNVGNLRRRKIPRDVLMATYFMRLTDQDRCSLCGICVDVCPVEALTADEGDLRVDEDWCIGCGVCVPRCPEGAAALRPRADKSLQLPASFAELHQMILEERSVLPEHED
jgi:Fe-S-cluster-containing hydrogenase component 2